jgi:hypothetical protein
VKRGPRGPAGSAETALLVGMSRGLRRDLARAAKRSGVTSTEYVRQAIRERLWKTGALPLLEANKKAPPREAEGDALKSNAVA